MTTAFHQVMAQCPVCLNEEELTIWDVIDTSTDPDLKEKLLRKTLQSLECRNCGHSTLIAAPLVYRDPKQHILIESRPDLGPDDLLVRLQDLQAAGPTLWPTPAETAPFRRLVASVNDLIEKILVHEQGLDDRALELVKFVVIKHQAQDTPIEELRLVGVAKSELNFVMKLEDGWFQYQLVVDAYHNAQMILEQTTDTLNHDPAAFALIDSTYAERMIDRFTAAMSDPIGQ
ncbi:MAG: CpXC domain-containing protein [Eubacteriales bacterium]|nr:CpXC domain-containing protein [Eubacteriales bacterium]